MTLIDITKTPLGYLQTHADEIEAAFSAGMSASALFRVLKASDTPPPMSYRNFCRLTNGQRNPSKTKTVSNKRGLSSVATKPKTDRRPDDNSFKIKTFEHTTK